MKERLLEGFIRKATALESECTSDPFIASLWSACDVNLARPTCSDIQSLKKIAPLIGVGMLPVDTAVKL